ncbi:MAG TPA: AAA family ATPase, partial [Solirubrobacterales bacterium]|nr:AAA family ATPase [Solirubrobacterales bacterium]
MADGGQLFDTGDASAPRGADAAAAGGPLASRMRPRSVGEFIGQGELLEPGSALRVAIESGQPHSAVFYGPPGTGKTTLARVIAAGAHG